MKPVPKFFFRLGMFILPHAQSLRSDCYWRTGCMLCEFVSSIPPAHMAYSYRIVEWALMCAQDLVRAFAHGTSVLGLIRRSKVSSQGHNTVIITIIYQHYAIEILIHMLKMCISKSETDHKNFILIM